MIASWQETNDKPRQCVEKQRHYSANKGPHSGGCGLPSGHIWLWGLGHKEGRRWNNWCLWTMLLEKTPDSPLDNKEIKPVSLKGDQPWIVTERTDPEAGVPVFWSFDSNRWLTGKVPVAGKDPGQKEKRASEDEMAGWHHRCSEHELWQALGDGQGQSGQPCCNLWGHKEVGTTVWLINNRLNALMKIHSSWWSLHDSTILHQSNGISKHFGSKDKKTVGRKNKNCLYI